MGLLFLLQGQPFELRDVYEVGIFEILLLHTENVLALVQKDELSHVRASRHCLLEETSHFCL